MIGRFQKQITKRIAERYAHMSVYLESAFIARVSIVAATFRFARARNGLNTKDSGYGLMLAVNL